MTQELVTQELMLWPRIGMTGIEPFGWRDRGQSQFDNFAVDIIGIIFNQRMNITADAFLVPS